MKLSRRSRDKLAPEVVHPPFGQEPPPPTDQTEQRRVRQSGGSAPPCAGFSLPVEFGEQLAPLERAIASLKRPAAMRSGVHAVAAAAATVTLVAAELIIESPGAYTDAQRRASQVISDLAAQAQAEEPAVTDQMIASGSWSAPLIAQAALVADDLGAMLARAHCPGSPALSGGESVAEQIERALRKLDRTVRDALAHLDRVARHQSLPTPEEFNRQRRGEAAAERQREAAYQAERRAEARRTMAAAGARR